MNRRVVVNLLVFGLAGLSTFAWAATNVFSFDALDDPFYVTAEFADSPGIRPGVEVAYLGVQVGQVADVDLADDRVVVRLRIDHGEEIPRGAGAAVARKSAVGEPFVDLSAPDGYDDGDPLLAEGDRIPLARTRVPVTYSSVFDNLDALIRAIPEDDLQTVVHELAVGLDGRGEDLRRTIVGTDDVLGTFAAEDEVLQQAIDELSRFVGTLAAHRDALGAGFDHLVPLSESLARARADLEATVLSGGGLAADLRSLVATNLGSLECTFQGLGTVVTGLDSDGVYTGLQSLFDAGPVLQVMWSAEGVLRPEADGTWLAAVPFLGVGLDGHHAPVLYQEPLTLPPTPAVPPCPGTVPAADALADGAAAAAGPTPGSTPTDSPAAPPPPTEAAAAEPASSDREASPRSPFNPLWLLPVLAAVAAIGVLRPWRHLPAHRPDPQEPPT